MDKIIDKLNELENSLQELKAKDNKSRYEGYQSIVLLLERIIDRIYPTEDARQLKNKMYSEIGEKETRGLYLSDIERAIRVINTIQSERELFGFDDFKPIKEESEWQLGSKNFGAFLRKKKSK